MSIPAPADAGFMSIGLVAARVGVSASGIRRLEASSAIPKSERVAGLDRRFWRADQLPAIKEAIASRRGLPAA